MLSRKYKATFGELIQPVNLVLHRLRVSPDHLTLAGLVFGALAGLAFAEGRLVLGGVFFGLSGLSDMLDGSLARAAGETTPFGSFLDSVTDRYTECLVFGGLAWHFASSPVLLLVIAALTGSLLVSYTKARAEALIGRCDVGLFERPERMIILIAGALSGLTVPALWLLAVFSHITALQRIHFTWRQTNGRKQ